MYPQRSAGKKSLDLSYQGAINKFRDCVILYPDSFEPTALHHGRVAVSPSLCVHMPLALWNHLVCCYFLTCCILPSVDQVTIDSQPHFRDCPPWTGTAPSVPFSDDPPPSPPPDASDWQVPPHSFKGKLTLSFTRGPFQPLVCSVTTLFVPSRITMTPRAVTGPFSPSHLQGRAGTGATDINWQWGHAGYDFCLLGDPAGDTQVRGGAKQRSYHTGTNGRLIGIR